MAASIGSVQALPRPTGLAMGHPASGLLSLDLHELLLVASMCGRDAPVLARVCRGLRDVWHQLRQHAPLLAETLVAAYPAAYSPHVAQRRSALERVKAAGVVRTVADPVATATLLRAGANVHVCNGLALKRAAKLGQADTVAALVKAGANVDGPALHRAAAFGHAHVVRLLLECGAGPRARPEHARWLATMRGHAGAVWELLHHHQQHGSLRTDDVGYLLYDAAERGRRSVVAVILQFLDPCPSPAHTHQQSRGVQPPPWRHHLQSALKAAAGSGCPATFQLLLNRLEEHEEAHAQLLEEAFLQAARQGRTATVEVLLELGGVDVHAKGDSALQFAFNRRNEELITLLLRRGADACTVRGFDLCYACEREDEKLVRLLLQYGVCQEQDQRRALLVAARCGHVGILQQLLAAGIDGHAQWTQAVNVACGYGQLHAVQLLVEAEAAQAFVRAGVPPQAVELLSRGWACIAGLM